MKRLFILLLVIIITCVAGAFIIVRFVADNIIENSLEVAVKKQLGRDIEFQGGVSLSLLPLALEAHEVRLLNPVNAGFSQQSMADIKTLSVQVQLMPLIRQQKLVVDTIMLKQPNITLTQLKNGTNNWQFAKALPPKTSTSQAAPNITVTTPSPTKDLFSLEVKQFHITNGTITFNNQQTQQHITAERIQLSGNIASLTSMAIQMEMALKQQQNSYHIALESSINIPSPKQIELSNTHIAINKQRLTMPTAQIDLRHKTPSIKASVQSKSFDLNAIIPTSAATETPRASTSSQSQPKAQQISTSPLWSTDPINSDALRAVNAEIDYTLTALKLPNMQIDYLKGNAIMQQGKADINIDNMEMAGGNIKGSVQAVAQTSQSMNLATRFWVSNIDMAQIIKKKDAKAKYSLTGRLNTRGQLETKGNSVAQFIQYLTGAIHVRLLEGVVEGIDIQSLLSNIPGVHAMRYQPASTEITEAQANLQINQGVVSNKDLQVKAGLLQMAGKGEVSLPAQTMRYTLTPTVTVKSKDPQDKSIQVPVLIQGSWHALTFTPQLEALLPKAKIEKNLEKIIQNPQDAKQILRDLRGGFKQDKKDLGDALENLGKGLLEQNQDAQQLQQLLKGF